MWEMWILRLQCGEILFEERLRRDRKTRRKKQREREK